MGKGVDMSLLVVTLWCLCQNVWLSLETICLIHDVNIKEPR